MTQHNTELKKSLFNLKCRFKVYFSTYPVVPLFCSYRAHNGFFLSYFSFLIDKPVTTTVNDRQQSVYEHINWPV